MNNYGIIDGIKQGKWINNFKLNLQKSVSGNFCITETNSSSGEPTKKRFCEFLYYRNYLISVFRNSLEAAKYGKIFFSLNYYKYCKYLFYFHIRPFFKKGSSGSVPIKTKTFNKCQKILSFIKSSSGSVPTTTYHSDFQSLKREVS